METTERPHRAARHIMAEPAAGGRTAALRIAGLTTGYGRGRRRRVVSAGLSAALPEGSLTALLGTNGAGKSTLLRTLAGLLPPLDGEVRWNGLRLDDYTARTLPRTVAVVLTGRPAAAGLTVADVVRMGRMPYTGFSGRLSAHDLDVADHAMELAGAARLRDRDMAGLSDGERQRAMIAKALAQQTPAILLDEPTAFLDFPGKVAMLRLLRDLAVRHGKTILFSSHDLELTFQTVERLWLLSPRGITEGSPRELAADGSLERFFPTDGARFDRRSLRFTV